MLLKQDDEHFNIHEIFQHLTIDFDHWHQMSEKDKIESWKSTWAVVSGFFNLFG